jgi:hypothetical protein
MVALVATIHVFFRPQRDQTPPKKAWMVGLKPTMTIEAWLTLCDDASGAPPLM